jgi:hypothetical protein
LLHLFDLNTPFELAGIVVSLGDRAGSRCGGRSIGCGLVEAIEAARERAGGYVAIDGPEYGLIPSDASAWARELRIALRAKGLRAVVNLNMAEPPGWARSALVGPLFPAEDPAKICDAADALVDCLFDEPVTDVRLDWHLSACDFQPAGRYRLLRLSRHALDGAPLAFVFDRPHRPEALAEGLDRRHTAVLAFVGVGLPRLRELLRAADGVNSVPAALLAKLGSLTRLALSAGRARRDFFRRYGRPAVTGEFLLDRARVVVVPVGLGEVVRAMTDQPVHGEDGGAVARSILLGLNGAIMQDGIPATLDGPPPSYDCPDDTERTASPRQQLRGVAPLSAAVGAGTTVVQLPADQRPTPEELARLLWYASQQPGLTRVRFSQCRTRSRQLSAEW